MAVERKGKGVFGWLIAFLSGKAGAVIVAATPMPPIAPKRRRDLFPEPVVRPVREPTKQEIATAAYYIWLREGKPEGQQVRHWLEAERQLRGKR